MALHPNKKQFFPLNIYMKNEIHLLWIKFNHQNKLTKNQFNDDNLFSQKRLKIDWTSSSFSEFDKKKYEDN